MQLNKLSPASGSTKTKKRVGRGVASGWGKNLWEWTQRSKV